MKLKKIGVYETDPTTGVKVNRPSRKWYAVFVDHAGVLRRLPLLEDRRASDALGRVADQLNALRSSNEILPAELSRAVESMPKAVRDRLAQWDIIPASKVAASKSLTAHLDDWKQVLLAKGNTPAYADLTVGRVGRIFDGCRFTFISDVSASRVQRFTASLRQDTTDASGTAHRGLSAASANYYLRDAKSFFRWLIADRRCAENPLVHLQAVKSGADRRHDRRAMSTDELQWLLSITINGAERHGMSGSARAMLYRLAVETGLRASELRSLTRGGFDFDAMEVTVAAAYTKNRKPATLPLKQSTADALIVYLQGKMPHVPAFALPKKDRIVDMFRADLADARQAWIADATLPAEQRQRTDSSFLSPVDERGLYADFHSLRHTFISNLAAGGVHPKTAQKLARHSTITLTMDRYTHVRREELSDALNALPDLDRQRQTAAATGTTGKTDAVGQQMFASLSPSLSPNSATRRNPTQLDAINAASDADEESLGSIGGNTELTDVKWTFTGRGGTADATDLKSVET